MSTPPQRRIVILELDVGVEPVAGVLCDEAGDRRAFTGWLGLASALEQAIRPGADGGPACPTTDPGLSGEGTA